MIQFIATFSEAQLIEKIDENGDSRRFCVQSRLSPVAHNIEYNHELVTCNSQIYTEIDIGHNEHG